MSEILPLLIVELNTVFVWVCLGYSMLYLPTADEASYRDTAVYLMLFFAVNLEPVNIFLYTWRFLETLESEMEGNYLALSRKFRVTSVWVVPVVYVLFYVSPVLVNAKCLILRQEGNDAAAD